MIYVIHVRGARAWPAGIITSDSCDLADVIDFKK